MDACCRKDGPVISVLAVRTTINKIQPAAGSVQSAYWRRNCIVSKPEWREEGGLTFRLRGCGTQSQRAKRTV
jgi:hypothetical protein